MKRISTLIVFAALLLFSSCEQGGDPFGAGSWHFKGNLYYIPRVSPSYISRTLIAESSTPSETDNVTFKFQSYPPTAGTYSIVKSMTPTASQVYVVIDIRGRNYVTSADGTSVATVTVNKDGKVNIKVPDATFANTGHTTDAGTFSADVVESYYQ